jgi:ABC-type transport system involved in multi-copper enzyme maturation permease subunit
MRGAAYFKLLRLSLLVIAGRRFWLLPLLPLVWLGVVRILMLIDSSMVYDDTSVQGPLLAVPLTLLAVFLGIRIIAGEIEDRSLEIAYTVPGGCKRIWFTKLIAAGLVIVSAEILVASAVYVFITPFPAGVLYGALQAAGFYLILAMAMATLFRSEAAGAMATAAVLGMNGAITDFGDNQIRISPFWNPYAMEDTDPTELFAWTLQNHIGILLAIVAIGSLAFMRANRREHMLGGS